MHQEHFSTGLADSQLSHKNFINNIESPQLTHQGHSEQSTVFLFQAAPPLVSEGPLSTTDTHKIAFHYF